MNDFHKPVLIVIAGPNGSGKTSVTSKILHHEWMEDSIYINPDIIAQEKFGDWNSKDAIMKAVKFCEELREACLMERKSLIFETVLSVEDKIDYICRAIEAGFIYDNSIENKEAMLLFRLAKGRLVKQYVEMIPEWASPIYSSDF